MGRIRFQHRLQWLLAACLLTVGTQAASMTKECALRDAQVLMRIEAHESMGATQESVQVSVDAMFTLMQARHLCHEGKVHEALALYDGIAPAFATDGRPARRPH
jgi:hypothetical protein